MKLRLFALLSVFALIVSACAADDEPVAETTTTAAEETTTTEAMEEMEETDEAGTIVDVAVGAGSFTTLVTAVQEAGLVETLSSDGPFTVFAPTDDAFAALPEGLLDTVLADTDLLTTILTYHVVSGAVPASDVVTMDSATTLQGEDVAISVAGDSVALNEANVVQTDIEASNGIIHVIDAVLLPPSVVEAMAAEEEAEEMADILATAEAAGSFTTLLTAVDAAGLTDTLMGDGPFTVFAPTDEAFAAVDEEVLNGLLADSEALAQVLLYHVVEGAVPAADVISLDAATTAQGSDLAISVEEDSVMVNEANVVQTDIETSNGIIHVIDAVLLPPSS